MIWTNNGEPAVNRIVDVTFDEGTVTEPVTVAEAQAYCRVQTGTAEDSLFAILITAARNAMEKATGLSLVSKTVHFTAYNYCGHFPILYGPVVSGLVIKDTNGVAIDCTVLGTDFPEIEDAFDDWFSVDFTGGYTTNIPAELKIAILAQVNFMYENRGDNSDGVTMCQTASNMALKYSRIPIIF